MKITEELLLNEGYKKVDDFGSFVSYHKGQIAFGNAANRKDCDWFMHLDNADYESVANIDVDSVEEANEFSEKLIGIKAFSN